jgi:alkaline phosphatase isozyme conversion protein
MIAHHLLVRITLVALWAGLLLAGVVAPGAAQAPIPDYTVLIDAQTLSDHVRALSVDIGARPAGSDAEAQAAAYVEKQFAAWGYNVTLQEFEITHKREALTTRNVIATRPGDGATIIVGAHMDSVTAGTGADDNASGLAVILAAAEVLADLDMVCPITFIAFGSEEIGLVGSQHYADGLTDEQIADILVMINVDTVGIGDYFYVYAGAITESQSHDVPYTPGVTWARDLALELGATLGHDVRTSPPFSWNGFTGPWSDHYPFTERGVPVVYFERWNWDAGDDPSWGQETAEQGDFLHTARDVFDNVDPAKMVPVAETLATLVAMLATDARLPDTPAGPP